MDARIDKHLDELISQHLQNPKFNNLTSEQKSEMAANLKNKLHQAAVDELIHRLNEDQINQIADLEVTSPEMEAKLEEFAATIPDFLSMLETRIQEELNNS